MRVWFRGTDAGGDADEYSLVCGVNGRDADGVEHALSFDRVSEAEEADNPEEDWGVSTQFDQQGYSGYDAVAQCRLSRSALSVNLSKQLGFLVGVTGFDIALEIEDELFEQFRAMLTRIFRGMPGVLVYEGPKAPPDLAGQ